MMIITLINDRQEIFTIVMTKILIIIILIKIIEIFFIVIIPDHHNDHHDIILVSKCDFSSNQIEFVFALTRQIQKGAELGSSS